MRQSTAAVAGSLALALVSGTLCAETPAPRWEVGRTVELNGLTVTLSKPRLVARSKGYLWFPTLVRLFHGDLLAIASNYPDENTRNSTSLTTFSHDGGLTWSEPRPALYSDTHLRVPGGDEILLPYYLDPCRDALVGPYQRVPRRKAVLERVKDGITVTGWPRPFGILEPKALGLGSFVFNGQTVTLEGGGYLATLYGYFKGTTRYSLVAAASADGLHWKVRSVIADERCRLKGAEGPCEAAVCRLTDGRLMCIFRLASNVPYGQCFSRDDGKTWTEALVLREAGSVQPSLAVMADGTVVLSGGRPGIKVWFNQDGTGKDWQPVDLVAHHNACEPREPIANPAAGGNTSSYTEIVAVDETHLLCIYDRIPRGWHAIPKDSAETNSVWVVRVGLTRK